MNHCREHGVNNCRDCGMRQLAADSFKAQITPAKEKDMKTEKVTKDVWAVLAESDHGELNFKCAVVDESQARKNAGLYVVGKVIPATLTYELPRKPVKEIVEDVEWYTSGNLPQIIYPVSPFVNNILGQFIGKRTRVTIEEIEEVE